MYDVVVESVSVLEVHLELIEVDFDLRAESGYWIELYLNVVYVL